MAVLIQSIESIEKHRQEIKKRLRKNTQKTDTLVNGARLAFQCLVYNTNKIADPF